MSPSEAVNLDLTPVYIYLFYILVTANKLINSLLLASNCNMRGAYDKFPDFFRMDTFIDSTHMKL